MVASNVATFRLRDERLANPLRKPELANYEGKGRPQASEKAKTLFAFEEVPQGL